MTKDARNALIRAHHQNINRYCRLLATPLAEHEREYIHKRIVEERLALEQLITSPPGADGQSFAPAELRDDNRTLRVSTAFSHELSRQRAG